MNYYFRSTIFILASFHFFCDKVHCKQRNSEKPFSGNIRGSTTNYSVKAKRELFSPSRIVNGSLAPKGRYPYAVKIGGCGGSLIAKDIVLTAGHCQDYLGSTVSLGENQDDVEYANIIETSRHPDYSRGYLSNDLMVIKIERNEKNLMKYPTIRLNAYDTVPQNHGDQLTVMGWGRLGEDKPTSEFLRHVDLKYVKNEECINAEGEFCHNGKCSYGHYKHLIQDDDMCATDIDEDGNVKDSCFGDSGSPLIIKGESPEDDVQVGIVSWGFECGNKDFPGVYSRVSHNIKWIERESCRLSTQGDKAEYCADESDSETFLTYVVSLDNYPQEHSWKLYEIEDNNEKLVVSKQDYTSKGMIMEEKIKVKPGQYKFVIQDTYGDGLAVRGANAKLYNGAVNNENLIEEWFGNWGKERETTFSIPEPPAPDRAHLVTAILKMNDLPRDLWWQIIELGDPQKVIAERNKGDYTNENEKIIEKINVSYGKSYRLLYKRKKNSDKPTSISTLTLFSGFKREKTRLGRIKMGTNRFSGKIDFNFLDNPSPKSREDGEKCYSSKDCISGKCRKGICRKKV